MSLDIHEAASYIPIIETAMSQPERTMTMTDVITSHGFKFTIEGAGFVRNHAEDDFAMAVEAIKAHLDRMDARTVSAVHYADAAWQDRDCEGDRPLLIGELEIIGHEAATAGWHKPSAAQVSVSAAR